MSPDETILVVEDDRSAGELIGLILERHGYRAVRVESVDDALERLAREPVDLILTDLELPQRGGLHLLAELSTRRFGPPVIVVSGRLDEASTRAARALGARDVIEKPFTVERLASAVAQGLLRCDDLAAVA
jgi:DNA-binding response OmpR family regulator